MTSFRSNLNSVPSTHDGLTAIRSRLTTCFKHLRHKFLKVEPQLHPESPFHEENLEDFRGNQGQRYPHKRWYRQTCKDAHLLRKANENLKNWTTQVRKVFSGCPRFPKARKSSEEENPERSQFVEKLLSSTLITSQFVAPFDCSENIEAIATATNNTPTTAAAATVAGVNNKMTIMGDSILSIREEYPDLDAEIRSILMARAQTGATIGEIKEDYRKNTGLRFPIYNNITDFLLCIPGVTAYCSESGTRIFNVKPTEKTKHIYDLIMQQKAPSERYGYPVQRNSNSRPPSSRNSDFNSNPAVPMSWRAGVLNGQMDYCTHLSGSSMNSSFHNSGQHQQQHQQLQEQPFMAPSHSVEENNSRNESDGLVERDSRGGYYQDNCQYLFNRIYNYDKNKDTINESARIDTNYNNNNNNLNIHGNPDIRATQYPSHIENQMRPNPFDQNDKDINLFKRPIGRPIRESIMRASSPSATRSSRRTDSIASSDMDYEAHLLDFPLLGDDFLLYLARMELRCKFRKNQKVLQSGLCVSGQTITAATKRVKNLPFSHYGNRRIIVNIGSVDVMQGKPLVQIEHDFRNLINVINKRGYQPILSTLAPLANYAHDSTIKTKIERFNDFIKREGQRLLVVDIWPLFMSERKQLLFDCYQNEPRQVTGTTESYVFWNKIGRQRVLQLIESNLEY